MEKPKRILIGKTTLYLTDGKEVKTYKSDIIEYWNDTLRKREYKYNEDGSLLSQIEHNNFGKPIREIYYKTNHQIDHQFKYNYPTSDSIIKEMILGEDSFHGKWKITLDVDGKKLKEEFFNKEDALEATDIYKYHNESKTVIRERLGLGEWKFECNSSNMIISKSGGYYSDDKTELIEYSYSDDIYPLETIFYSNYGQGKILTSKIRYSFEEEITK